MIQREECLKQQKVFCFFGHKASSFPVVAAVRCFVTSLAEQSEQCQQQERKA